MQELASLANGSVREIQELALTAFTPKTDIPVAVVPNDHNVKSLESYQLQPSLIRQAVKLISASSLIAYVKSFPTNAQQFSPIKQQPVSKRFWIITRPQIPLSGLIIVLFTIARIPMSGKRGPNVTAAR